MLEIPLAVGVAAAIAQEPAEGSVLNRPGAPLEARLHAELGFVAPLAHSIQFGTEGTRLDYVQDGGQDNLFPFARLSTDLHLGRPHRHVVVLLWQPLDLRSRVVLDDPLVVDDERFEAGTPVDLRYGFSFWRGSWMYDVLGADEHELGLGLSVQIRLRDRRVLGADPVLQRQRRVRRRGRADRRVGARRVPLPPRHRGVRQPAVVRGRRRRHRRDPSTGDGYTRNWLHLATVSLGLTLR